jgi:hypothetical protein
VGNGKFRRCAARAWVESERCGSFGPYPVPWRASSVFPPRQQDRLRTSPPPRRTGGSRSAPSDCDRQRRSVPRGGFLGVLAVSELGRSACRVVSCRGARGRTRGSTFLALAPVYAADFGPAAQRGPSRPAVGSSSSPAQCSRWRASWRESWGAVNVSTCHPSAAGRERGVASSQAVSLAVAGALHGPEASPCPGCPAARV